MLSARKIRHFFYLTGVMITLVACSSSGDDNKTYPKPQPKQIITSQGVSVPVYDFNNLRQMMDVYNDTVAIYNFWATWCQPCVKEMPYFNMADSAYSDKPVQIILVSLDFVEVVEETLIPFILEHELKPTVIVLDEMDPNSWIPQVDPDWEGNIPATLFKKNGHEKFTAFPITYDELVNDIEHFLNL